ncbi:MAG: PaaI family thioesterase [Pseudomonadota bacterium]
MSQINPAYVTAVKESVRHAAYPALMSMTIADIDQEGCVIALAGQEKHLQPFGIIHGGVIATLIDTATFWAVFLSLPSAQDGLVNVDLKLNYLSSVTGGELRATGRKVRMGRTIGYSEAHVHDDKGRLIAHGTSTLMVLPGKGLDLGVPRELT